MSCKATHSHFIIAADSILRHIQASKFFFFFYFPKHHQRKQAEEVQVLSSQVLLTASVGLT